MERENNQNLMPLSEDAATMLSLFRRLPPEKKSEFMRLLQELSEAKPEEVSSGPVLTETTDV